MTQPSSPLPWKIDEAKDLPLAIIQDSPDGLGVAEGDVGRDPFQKQDFEYIVEACNNYPRAIELLKHFVDKVESGKARSFETYNLYKDFLKSVESE